MFSVVLVSPGLGKQDNHIIASGSLCVSHFLPVHGFSNGIQVETQKSVQTKVHSPGQSSTVQRTTANLLYELHQIL